MESNRLEAFSDGVLAIIITVIVCQRSDKCSPLGTFSSNTLRLAVGLDNHTRNRPKMAILTPT